MCFMEGFILARSVVKIGEKAPPAPTVAFSRRGFHFLPNHTWLPAANVSSFLSLFPPLFLSRGGGTGNGRVLSVGGKCQEGF